MTEPHLGSDSQPSFSGFVRSGGFTNLVFILKRETSTRWWKCVNIRFLMGKTVINQNAWHAHSSAYSNSNSSSFVLSFNLLSSKLFFFHFWKWCIFITPWDDFQGRKARVMEKLFFMFSWKIPHHLMRQHTGIKKNRRISGQVLGKKR